MMKIAGSENDEDTPRHQAFRKMIFMSLLDRNVQKYATLHSRIEEICRPVSLTDETLLKIMDLLLEKVEEGLSGAVENPSLKMLPSYVRAVPNGTETGKYLALDLGGTNFRVLLVTLEGDGKAEMVGTTYRIPHSIMVGTGEQLFSHIADCLAKFIEDEELTGQKLPLGFTFSFPCRQDGLAKGSLIKWTKGFKASGVEGEDIVQLLHEACEKRGDLSVGVTALLNDTTGTLMSCALEDNACQIGIIVGTGSNTCYMEKLSKCPKLGDIKDEGPDEMIINTEWGAFGDDGALDFILTEFDQEVDQHSINPGQQRFEKMMSGMYMGELVRLILVKMAKEGLLFEGECTEELETPGKFPTKYVSEIEIDMRAESSVRTFQRTFDILEDLGIENLTAADCANVAYVCEHVSTRAAHLCAAGITTILNRMQKPSVTVGVDGSVYRFHPTFKTLLEQKISNLINPKLKFQLKLSEDGSGKGAALVAAVQTRVEKEKLGKKASRTAVLTVLKKLSQDQE